MVQDIFRGGHYPLIYASMCCETASGAHITDSYNRMRGTAGYHGPGYPTTEVDGGWRNLVGGYPDQNSYTSMMDACASLPVFEGLDMIVAIDYISTTQVRTRVRVANGVPANTKPNDPDAPVAEPTGPPLVPYEIKMATFDPDNDQIYYMVDWGDGAGPGEWQGPFQSSDSTTLSNIYQAEGPYQIIVRVKDEWDETTDWSPATSIIVGCCTMVGDIDNDGNGPNINDLVSLVLYMFQSGDAPECMDHADINGDGLEQPNIEDLVYLVQYMFQDGPALPDCPY